MSGTLFPDGQAYDFPLLIGKLLQTPLIQSPDKEIVYRDQYRYTYRELERRIHRLAGALSAMGVSRGDTVAVLDYDSPRYLECFFGIPMMGAVLQTVNWRLSPEQISYTLNHAEARVILVNADFLPLLEGMHPDLATVRTIVLLADQGSSAETRLELHGEYEALLAAADAVYGFEDFDERCKATTFYTTGTTGKPKGVHFSHRQLVLHTLSLAVAAGSYATIGRFRSDDVYMPLTPMFHVHAWGLPYVATLLGVKQVYPGRYEPKKLLELIAREQVTFSHCVPTILQMLMVDPLCRDIDLSNWKVIIGGARLPRGQAKAARDLGICVFTGYGMSETCPVMSLATPKAHMLDLDEEQMLDVITKTGTPIPLVEIEVVDSEDTPLPHDGVATGEVVFRAPWLTVDYFKSPEKTRELWRNGYLHSGDVGHIDAEGYLQVTDRIKDVIKSGGEWISSLDLENILSQHEAVLESAAIGVPDEKWGERPVMLAVLKPGMDGVRAETLLDFMHRAADKGKLPRYGVPDRIIVVPALAKTSVGKLNKRQIRAELTRQR